MSIKQEPGTVTGDLTEQEPHFNDNVRDIKNNSEENFQVKTECCLLEEDSSLPNATVSKAQWFESSNTDVKEEVRTLNVFDCEEGCYDQNSLQHKKETSAVPTCLQSSNILTTDTHCKTDSVLQEHQAEFQNFSSDMVLKSEPIMSINTDTDNNSFFSKNVQDFQKSHPTVADLIQNQGEQVKLYQCGTCPYSCNFLFDLYQHNLSHTMGNCYICDLCQSPYPYFLDLKYHLMSHADDDEISSQLLHGNKNISGRHIDEQPYSCDLCDYTCIDSSLLIRHNRERHTDVRPYSCDFCRFTCADSRNLKIHRKTHTVKKTYSCDFCSYTSVYSSALKQHIKNHTEEKPYSCDLCDFTCTRSFNLRRHQRTHTDDKPFCCDLCDFKSAYEPNLKEHKKHHTGEKPYACDLCDFTSAYSFSLKLLFCCCSSFIYTKMTKTSVFWVPSGAVDVCAKVANEPDSGSEVPSTRRT